MEEINEEWRDIPGYEGIYKVSNTGKVKSLERNVKGKNCSIYTIKEKILNPVKNRKGYLQVVLFKEGIMKCIKIHRLVAETFLKNPNNLPQINHINEIKTDNRVENLEYCDAKYNSNFGTRNERVSKSNTNNPKRSKAVKCIETGKIYPSAYEVQRQLGFNHRNISACCNKMYGRKTVGNLHWEYVD